MGVEQPRLMLPILLGSNWFRKGAGICGPPVWVAQELGSFVGCDILRWEPVGPVESGPPESSFWRVAQRSLTAARAELAEPEASRGEVVTCNPEVLGIRPLAFT